MRLAARLLATASIATGVTAGSIIAPPAASAGTLDDVVSETCDLLAISCDTSELETLVTETLTPTTIAPAPTPVPAPVVGESPEPAPAPAPSGGTEEAASATTPTGFATTGSSSSSTDAAADAPRGSAGPAVPDVPVGGRLDLDPLGLPAIALDASAGSADELPPVVEHLVQPAAAALAPDASNGAKATAVVVAFGALLLAGALLLDQVRKARIPFRL